MSKNLYNTSVKKEDFDAKISGEALYVDDIDLPSLNSFFYIFKFLAFIFHYHFMFPFIDKTDWTSDQQVCITSESFYNTHLVVMVRGCTPCG